MSSNSRETFKKPLSSEAHAVLRESNKIFMDSGLATKYFDTLRELGSGLRNRLSDHPSDEPDEQWLEEMAIEEVEGIDDAARAELALAIAVHEPSLHDSEEWSGDQRKWILSMVEVNPMSGDILLSSPVKVGYIDRSSDDIVALGKFNLNDFALAQELYDTQENVGLHLEYEGPY